MIHYDPHAGGRSAAVIRLATAAGIPVRSSNTAALATLAATARHQGIAASTEPFPYAELAAVVATHPALLIVADQLQDPHNLGALLRTAAATGVGGVILPKDGSVAVTPTVEAAAAGAAAAVPICRVTNLVRTLGMLKESSYWTLGLAPRASQDLFALDPPRPVVVVLGGETGLRSLVASQCDFLVSIPMFGVVESLNASVAAAVVLYELRRRWRVA